MTVRWVHDAELELLLQAHAKNNSKLKKNTINQRAQTSGNDEQHKLKWEEPTKRKSTKEDEN